MTAHDDTFAQLDLIRKNHLAERLLAQAIGPCITEAFKQLHLDDKAITVQDAEQAARLGGTLAAVAAAAAVTRLSNLGV